MAFFDVIYADCAWPYRNLKTGGSHTSGAVQKYPTMSLDDIKQMPVRQIANPKGSMCFLWATVPLGRDPYDVLDAWGYTFKTEWFWHKTGRMGTGYWTRGEVEKLLIGVRGKVPAWRSSLTNWIEEPLTLDTFHSTPDGHSQKPEAFIRRIEELTPNAGRRCELFATHHSAGLANQRTAEPTLPGMELVALPTIWECFGLDLGQNFLDQRFWTELIEGCRA